MQRITEPIDILPITRKRECAKGQFNDVIHLKTAPFGALSNAQIVKKGKGKGTGKSRLSEGMASSSKNASDYIHNIKIQINMVKCQSLSSGELGGHPQVSELF